MGRLVAGLAQCGRAMAALPLEKEGQGPGEEVGGEAMEGVVVEQRDGVKEGQVQDVKTTSGMQGKDGAAGGGSGGGGKKKKKGGKR